MTVRVRFAPSPTGALHIGSVRTILYNYLFARQRDGTLILRVEDTDQDRLVAGAIDSIYDGLKWMGVSWDEGPREGGPHAPYIQSERLPRYQKAAQELVDRGAAYFCFCSKERLAALRAQQAANKQITRYDRHCRNIDPKEAAERAKTEPHVIRLKVPDDGTIAIDDLVYGHVEWPLNTIEDQVLLKSDGFPTYHLAVVIDDHVMEITHIFRGEDWLPRPRSICSSIARSAGTCRRSRTYRTCSGPMARSSRSVTARRRSRSSAPRATCPRRWSTTSRSSAGRRAPRKRSSRWTTSSRSGASTRCRRPAASGIAIGSTGSTASGSGSSRTRTSSDGSIRSFRRSGTARSSARAPDHA